MKWIRTEDGIRLNLACVAAIRLHEDKDGAYVQAFEVGTENAWTLHSDTSRENCWEWLNALARRLDVMPDIVTTEV